MNLTDGRITFLAPHREPIYYPLGPTVATVIDGKVVSESKPTVFFSKYRYDTEDARTARAMVADKTNFNAKWGYTIAPECLPAAIAEFWPGLSTETRRKVLFALIDGKTEEEAFELIPENEAGPEPIIEEQPQRIVNCPMPNCGAIFQGSNGPAALVAHVFASHPDYNPEQ